MKISATLKKLNPGDQEAESTGSFYCSYDPLDLGMKQTL